MAYIANATMRTGGFECTDIINLEMTASNTVRRQRVKGSDLLPLIECEIGGSIFIRQPTKTDFEGDLQSGRRTL
jgi:hypothetical protein